MKKLSKKEENKRGKKMGMVDEWSEMSLKRRRRKEMKFMGKEKRLSERGRFWVKWVKMEKKWGKIEGVSYEGFRERKWT